MTQCRPTVTSFQEPSTGLQSVGSMAMQSQSVGPAASVVAADRRYPADSTVGGGSSVVVTAVGVSVESADHRNPAASTVGGGSTTVDIAEGAFINLPLSTLHKTAKYKLWLYDSFETASGSGGDGSKKFQICRYCGASINSQNTSVRKKVRVSDHMVCRGIGMSPEVSYTYEKTMDR